MSSAIWRLVLPSAMRSRIRRSCPVRLARSGSSSGPSRSRRRTRSVSAGLRSDSPAATRRTSSTRLFPPTCFSTYPDDPAMIEANRASSSAYDVSMMQAVSGICDRISLHTSTPLPDVEDGHVGTERGDPGEGLGRRSGLPHHLEVLRRLEQGAQSGAHDLVIVEEEHAYRHRRPFDHVSGVHVGVRAQ